MKKKPETKDLKNFHPLEFYAYLPIDIIGNICEFLPSKVLIQKMRSTCKDVKKIVNFILNERIKQGKINYKHVIKKFSFEFGKKTEYISHEILDQETLTIIYQYTYQKKHNFAILKLFSDQPNVFQYLITIQEKENMFCKSLKDFGFPTQIIIYNEKEAFIHCFEKKKILHHLEFLDLNVDYIKVEGLKFIGKELKSDFLRINFDKNLILFNFRYITLEFSYDGEKIEYLNQKNYYQIDGFASGIYTLNKEYVLIIEEHFVKKVVHLTTNKIVARIICRSDEFELYGGEFVNNLKCYKLDDTRWLLLDDIFTTLLNFESNSKFSFKYFENQPKKFLQFSDRNFVVGGHKIIEVVNSDLKEIFDSDSLDFLNEEIFITLYTENSISIHNLSNQFEQLGEVNNIEIDTFECLKNYQFFTKSKKSFDVYQFLPE